MVPEADKREIMTTPLEQLREACANELDVEIEQIRSYDKFGAMRNICGALVVVRDRIRAIDLTQFEQCDKQEEK